MVYFFEFLRNNIGFSRIGRINLKNTTEKKIKTPNIIIPIKNKTIIHFPPV